MHDSACNDYTSHIKACMITHQINRLHMHHIQLLSFLGGQASCMEASTSSEAEAPGVSDLDSYSDLSKRTHNCLYKKILKK